MPQNLTPETLRKDALGWDDSIAAMSANAHADAWAADRKRLEFETGGPRYLRADGKPVFVRLTWPTGAKAITTLAGLAYALPDYLSDEMAGYNHEDENWAFEVIEMTQEEYDALPEFAGP